MAVTLATFKEKGLMSPMTAEQSFPLYFSQKKLLICHNKVK